MVNNKRYFFIMDKSDITNVFKVRVRGEELVISNEGSTLNNWLLDRGSIIKLNRSLLNSLFTDFLSLGDLDVVGLDVVTNIGNI